MIVSALVLTLSEDPSVRARALEELGRHPCLSLGEPVDLRLPVVAETQDAGQGATLCDALGQWPGVARVDVVSIEIEEEPDGSAPAAWGAREELGS